MLQVGQIWRAADPPPLLARTFSDYAADVCDLTIENRGNGTYVVRHPSNAFAELTVERDPAFGLGIVMRSIQTRPSDAYWAVDIADHGQVQSTSGFAAEAVRLAVEAEGYNVQQIRYLAGDSIQEPRTVAALVNGTHPEQTVIGGLRLRIAEKLGLVAPGSSMTAQQLPYDPFARMSPWEITWRR